VVILRRICEVRAWLFLGLKFSSDRDQVRLGLLLVRASHVSVFVALQGGVRMMFVNYYYYWSSYSSSSS